MQPDSDTIFDCVQRNIYQKEWSDYSSLQRELSELGLTMAQIMKIFREIQEGQL